MDASTTRQNGSSSTASTPRQEAPALPVKRGEIGYDGSAPSPSEVDLASGVQDVLNSGPHPAERPSSPASSPSTRTTTPTPPSSIIKPGRTRALFGNLRSSAPNKRLGGVSNATVLRIACIVVCLTAVIALWVFAIKVLATSSIASTQENGGEGASIAPSLIFVHVAFAMAVCILLVFGERIIYQARVERFAFKNPGGMGLPRHRTREDQQIPYAPWNRSPLPTYAAAMNVRGTGDVEDEVIAAPPPPAYGNTRGSVLLLAGIPSLRSSESGGSIVPPNDDEDRRSTRSGRRVVSWGESIRSFITGSPSLSEVDPEAQRPTTPTPNSEPKLEEPTTSHQNRPSTSS